MCWKNGNWDFDMFKNVVGEVDWDVVIDVEVVYRKMLEDNSVVYDEDGFFDIFIVLW